MTGRPTFLHARHCLATGGAGPACRPAGPAPGAGRWVLGAGWVPGDRVAAVPPPPPTAAKAPHQRARRQPSLGARGRACHTAWGSQAHVSQHVWLTCHKTFSRSPCRRCTAFRPWCRRPTFSSWISWPFSPWPPPPVACRTRGGVAMRGPRDGGGGGGSDSGHGSRVEGGVAMPAAGVGLPQCSPTTACAVAQHATSSTRARVPPRCMDDVMANTPCRQHPRARCGPPVGGRGHARVGLQQPRSSPCPSRDRGSTSAASPAHPPRGGQSSFQEGERPAAAAVPYE